MVTPILGIILMALVFIVALADRAGGKIGFFDWHAAAVVFGGTLASLLLAIDRSSLKDMLKSIRDLFPSTSIFSHQMHKNFHGVDQIKQYWQEGKRASVLELAEQGETMELKTMATALVRQLNGSALSEQFMKLRSEYEQTYLPNIEGWEMISKLAPSFGMVGTVSGMVQLFRNMAEHSGNLGGAMAMALLATLYGITFGAAVGGPMASRINNQLNEKLTLLDLMEKTVAALVEENVAVKSNSSKS